MPNEDIGIISLRNDKKFRKSVHKELISLGLKVTKMSLDLSDISSDSSLRSDRDRKVTLTLHILVLINIIIIIKRRRRKSI